MWCIHMDTTAAWKKLHFILLDWSDLHMTNSLLIAVYAFARRVLIGHMEVIPVRYMCACVGFAYEVIYSL